jgi:hypothetical protein
MTLQAPAPTHAVTVSKPPAGAPTATGSPSKAPLWAFVVGAGILVAMADTRAAPLAVSVAAAAVLFQLLRL